MQDVTPVDKIQEDPKCERDVTLFGYSRGTKFKPGARVHIAGVGDFTVSPVILGHNLIPFPDPNHQPYDGSQICFHDPSIFQ